jgi:hypothetical protein
LSEGHYSGEGSYIAASLNDTDIDNLGDYYIDKLAKRWIDTSRSVEKKTKGKWTPPEELKSGIRAEKLSSSEKRSWLKKFYKRMAMGKDSGYIDAWWKDYRKSIGGFTADIAHKPLLEKYYE